MKNSYSHRSSPQPRRRNIRHHGSPGTVFETQPLQMRSVILISSVLVFGLIARAEGQAFAGEQSYLPGENLKYQLYYGPLNAGEAVMKLEHGRMEGREVLHAVMLGYTTGLADRLFRVYDVYESFMDPETGLPLKAIRNISEGRYQKYNEVIYDRYNNRVISQLSGIKETPPGILDIVSSIYKLRDTMPSVALRDGEVIRLMAYFTDELYPLVIRYRGTETIRTRMGRFHALKFSPVSEPGRLFRTEDDITIWFSNDRNYVPLRVRLNMLVGAVRMDLVEAGGLRYELREAGTP